MPLDDDDEEVEEEDLRLDRITIGRFPSPSVLNTCAGSGIVQCSRCSIFQDEAIVSDYFHTMRSLAAFDAGLLIPFINDVNIFARLQPSPCQVERPQQKQPSVAARYPFSVPRLLRTHKN